MEPRKVLVNPHYFYWRYLFWPQLAGIVFLLFGLIVVRKQLFSRTGSLTVLGRVFVPFALAVFGAEHLCSANFMKDMVPSWMPAHLFWIYLVGVALFSAAISIVLDKYVEVSASLLGLMFLLFVLMLHVPFVISAPRDRFAWAVASRDFTFGLGAWTLAAMHFEKRRPALARRLMVGIRTVAALIFLFFGIEQLLHPEYIPGVPLRQLTPSWMPWNHAWGFGIGVLLLASGVAILINRRPRLFACLAAVGATTVVVCMNVPMLILAHQPSEINTAVNYIGDTLLFAGTIFFLASAMPVAPHRSPAVSLENMRLQQETRA